MFKTRNIVDTSGKNMVRIEKRERILSIAIHGLLDKVPTDKAPGLTRLSIIGYNRDYIDWKISMIESAQWLTRENVPRASFAMWMSWIDSNKLRIYRKWLYHNNKKTLKNVLKYMYSPLFPAVFFMENGGLDEEYDCAYFRLWHNSMADAEIFKEWLKDVLDLDAVIIVGQYDIPCLAFCGENKDKFLDTIEPIVKQIPSKYANFRRVFHG